MVVGSFFFVLRLVLEFGNCGIPEQNFHLNLSPPQARQPGLGLWPGCSSTSTCTWGWGWVHCVLLKGSSRIGSQDRELRARVRDFFLLFRSAGFSHIPISAQVLCPPLVLINSQSSSVLFPSCNLQECPVLIEVH